MRPTSSLCDPARLKRLLDNRLEPDEEAQTISHLDGCAPCQKALEAMAAGSGLWGVARHLDDLWDPEQGAAAKAAMQELGPHADRAAVDEGALDFLEPTDRSELLGMIGSYEVVRVLGRGGMGVVFQAFEPALNRAVVIKVLAPELSTSGMARRRFAREAQATAAIVHDHVIAIHAVEANARLPYIVMQYVPGRSLQERIDRAGPLTLAEVLRIGMQVASGLAAAHAQGVIHRDIKPANILLESSVERVKITDFGLARALDDASMTQSGVITGTPQYMAPEQARGEHVDHRADLFSLGSLLYTMCTGRSPFRAETTLAVLRRVVEDHPRPIREVNPDIPGWLEAIVSRLHAKDPAARFDSAAHVAELLGQCLAHVQQPSTVALPNELTTADVPARRRAVRVRSAAAVGLILLAGLGAGEATGVTKLADAVVSVLRIRTDHGTLLVEISDPEVKVSIDDMDLVIHGSGLQEVRLRPGVHKLRTQPPGGPDTTELIEITRGGSRMARVSREPEPTKLLEPGADGRRPDANSAATNAQPEARQPDGQFLAMVERLTNAEKPRDAVNRRVRNPLDPALVIWERKVKDLRDEILRRWPAEAHAAEQAGIVKQLDEYQAEINASARRQDDPAIRDVLTRLERLLDEIALLDRNVGRPGDLDLDTLRQRLQDAADRRKAAKRLSRDPNDPAIRLIEQQIKSLSDEIKKRFPDAGRTHETATDESTRIPAAPATLEEMKGRFVQSLAFSPDGKTLATAGSGPMRAGSRMVSPSGELFLWDVRSGQLRAAVAEPRPIQSVAFSPDGRLMATSGHENPATLRDALTGQVLNTLPSQERGPNHAVVFSPDGQTIATSGRFAVTLWDVGSRRKLRSLGGMGGAITSTAFAPDGKTLLAVAANAALRQWDVATGRSLLDLKVRGGHVYCVVIAPAGDIAATTDADNTVTLWDLAGGRELARLEGHKESAVRAAFSPDGKTLATCSASSTRTDASGEVILWDVASRSKRLSLERASGEFYCTLAYSPDGAILATTTFRGAIRLWDLRGEKPVPFLPEAVAPTQGFFVPTLPGSADLFSFLVGAFY